MSHDYLDVVAFRFSFWIRICCLVFTSEILPFKKLCVLCFRRCQDASFHEQKAAIAAQKVAREDCVDDTSRQTSRGTPMKSHTEKLVATDLDVLTNSRFLVLVGSLCHFL